MIQEQMISKILKTKDTSLIIMERLDESFFSNYRTEWRYLCAHLNKYGCIPDIESFLSNFPDFDYIDVQEPTSYLVDELYKEQQSNKLAETFNKVRKLLLENKTEDAVNLYRNAYEEISISSPLTTIDILKDTSRYEAYAERTQDFNKFYISTGFKELDAVIGGWDRQEELATIVARPNVGKSWILLKCALAAAQQGLNVGIYSGEMSERKVGYRIDTLLQHISNGALIHGSPKIMNEYKKYIDSLPSKVPGTIRVLTPAMINGLASVTSLRAFIEKDNLDVLFIDQHSLLEDDRKAKNPVERASHISKDLKQLQVLKRIPIISVSQQNRSSTENGVGTEMVAQSDRISQDSTILIFIERKKDTDVLDLSLVKSRDSENGKKLSYKVDFNTGTFTYIPGENDVKTNTESYDNSRYQDDGDEVF